MKFVREPRYLILKLSDCNNHLTVDERRTLDLIATKIGIGRTLANKAPLTCVVVESDWPSMNACGNRLKKDLSQKRAHNERILNVDEDVVACLFSAVSTSSCVAFLLGIK